MPAIRPADLRAFIETNIPDFHQKRLASLSKLSLDSVLKRKNPYLYKAKNINTSGEFVHAMLDAHLSSQEETIFGAFLEQLAIFVCDKVYGGKKSSAEGIDLEFIRDGTLHLVSIKSGPNWGNSGQIQKMKDHFRKAAQILGTNRRSKQKTIFVNGCCYGREKVEEKGDYLKLCGQRFWECISGSDTLYTDIVAPLGHRAKERNDEFQEEYAKVINRFDRDFLTAYCGSDGRIRWEDIVALNSSAT
jgi:hypothetical protein